MRFLAPSHLLLMLFIIATTMSSFASAAMMKKLIAKVFAPKFNDLSEVLAVPRYDEKVLAFWDKKSSKETVEYLIDLRKLRANQISFSEMCAKWNPGGDALNYKINLSGSQYDGIKAACRTNSGDKNVWYAGESGVKLLAMGKFPAFKTDVENGVIQLPSSFRRRRKHSSSLKSSSRKRKL